MEEISDIKRDFNISRMCRSCLIETDEEMIEIFSNSDESNSLNLSQVLKLISTNVQVSALI